MADPVWTSVMLMVVVGSGVAQITFPSEQACFDAKPTVERAFAEERHGSAPRSPLSKSEFYTSCLRIPAGERR